MNGGCLTGHAPRESKTRAYRLLSVTESGDSVSIYWDYQKSIGAITIAQLFKFKNQKISEILLVFDGRGFA